MVFETCVLGVDVDEERVASSWFGGVEFRLYHTVL